MDSFICRFTLCAQTTPSHVSTPKLIIETTREIQPAVFTFSSGDFKYLIVNGKFSGGAKVDRPNSDTIAQNPKPTGFSLIFFPQLGQK